MTDLTPNDLSHMSDEDFNALCPQGHHAPGAEPLSPAAQAVLSTYEKVWSQGYGSPLAAALRTVADQCINRAWSVEMDDLYKELYAIAAELEGQ